MRKKLLSLMLAAAFLPVTSAFAEPAPVFDVENIQGQYDGAYEVDQDLPPPPAPGNDSMFVPSRSSQAQHEADSPDMLPFEQRVSRLEHQIDYLKSNAGSPRIDSLQTEVQTMRGQLDLLSKKLEKMEGQQKTLYADLDNRLLELKQNGLAATDAAGKPSPKQKIAEVSKPKTADNAATSQPNVEEEQEIYQTAYTLIKEKKYNEAVNALHRMLAKYPSGQFASNAHYWLGELYGLMNQNEKALDEFSKVVKHYPDSPRVSDAQLKIGLLYAGNSKWSEAKAAFKKVINRYPGTASARLASEQLKQLRSEGH